MPKKVFLLLVFAIFLFVSYSTIFGSRIKKGPTDNKDIYSGVSYKAIDPSKYEVSLVTKDLFSPTRLKITPDGKHLIVTQITGEVLAFDRDGMKWKKEPYLITKVKTRFKGFPPEEAGLVGVAFSNNFENNGFMFLLYNFKQKDGKVQNRISRVKIVNLFGRLKGINQKQIWQANVFGTGSHQITDAVGLKLDGEDRILFLIGEGFDGKKAQDPNLDAGKVISIKEDGTNKKIHAIGLRNGYVMVKSPNDPDGKILISDTGPDKYDRLIYTNPTAGNLLNFAWDGNQESLAKKIPDPNFKSVTDMVVLRLPETKTFTGLSFDGQGNIVATLFGKTGNKENSPGKEVLVGKLNITNPEPTISLTTIVIRDPIANGFLGNPIGLEYDKENKSLLFADIMEGRIYQIKERG